MPVRKYPYQNLSLIDIKGENWDDVPGYEGEYQVSDFGRIKSLRRWRNSGNNSGYYTKEFIRKPIVSFNLNSYIHKKTYLISIVLKSQGKQYTTAIARFVYYVFVEPFDIDNPDIIVSYKDYDGRNVTPSNLFLTTRELLSQRSYQLGRTYSQWEQNSLPVVQVDMKNRVVAKFKSISEASRLTGFNLAAISACMKGKIYQHKGFRWKSANKKAQVNNEPGDIFNKYLWKKIGCPKTSKTNPIPVLNLSLKTLPGERWKFIEGLNNAYQVSNLGRVKSVARFKYRYHVWSKAHIQRLIADSKPNSSAYSLLAQLSKNGRKFQQSVARLVYFHFVKKFDLGNKAIKMGIKDGCCYNLTPKNLYLKSDVISK